MNKFKALVLRWYYRWMNRRAWKAVDLGQVSTESLQLPGGEGDIGARLYRPQDSSDSRLLIYIHGGGWCIGDLETHDPFCRRLADEAGCALIALDYRLAPEHNYPAAAEDCLAAVSYILENRERWCGSGAEVFIAGDSAGGNLSAIVSNELCKQGNTGLKGQILIYPAVRHVHPPTASCLENAKGYGLTKDLMEWFWDSYLGSGNQPIDGAIGPLATPLYEDLPGQLPPALVITAGLDPLRDEGAEYAAKLDSLGVPCMHQLYMGEMHGFVCSEGMTDGHLNAMQLMTGWMDATGARHPGSTSDHPPSGSG